MTRPMSLPVDHEKSARRDSNPLPVRLVTAISPILVGIALVVFYSQALRPIWYDEMVYFVLGGLNGPAELLTVLRETTSNIHQGQTGVYMALVFASLKTTGASLWSFRGTSVAFGTLFVVTSLLYLRRKGLSLLWQMLFLALLGGATTLMYYVGEARVYIALTALTTAALLFYSYGPQDRRMHVLLFGWVMVPALAVIHPYAIIYLPLVMMVGYTFDRDTSQRWTVRGLVAWSRPKLAVVAFMLYVSVALLTWGRGTANFDVDPLQFIARPFAVELIYQHLAPLMNGTLTLSLWMIVGLAATAFIVRFRRKMQALESLIAPLTLMGLALVASIAISLLSLLNEFWIMPRQWIASLALCIIALAWLLQRVWQILDKESRLAALSFKVAVVLVSLASTLPVARDQLDVWIITSMQYPIELPGEFGKTSLAERLATGDALSDKDWLRFAHTNTIEGGRVWSEFASYYRDNDWSSFSVVMDGNQLTIYD